MATPFDNNPTFRKVTYKAQWIVNGVLAVLAAYFAATTDGITEFPEWYLVAVAVLPVLWTYLGVQADTNTSAPPPGQAGLAILGLIGAILLIFALIAFFGIVLHFFVVSWAVVVVSAIVGLVLLYLDRNPGVRGRF